MTARKTNAMADLSIAGIVALQAVDFESWSAWKDSLERQRLFRFEYFS
jgi:hypothetical protein